MTDQDEFVPTKKELIDRILVPFQRFLHAQSSGGIVLLVCTIAALIWANSPWSRSYDAFWNTDAAIEFGSHRLSEPLVLWINDALMAAFFFVVGLEIKRELLVGELASIRKAALPIAGAIGGMVFPALIFTALTFRSGDAVRGWGIPMATDIAFAIGILALLGDRVCLSGKVFLTALAIVDDIGAALVIALFYTAHISVPALSLGMAFFGLMVLANRIGVRSALAYAVLGLGLWLSFLESGVHPTIAGILGALAIPARSRINAEEFIDAGEVYIERFAVAGETGSSVLTNPEQRGSLKAMEKACLFAQTPLQRLENQMHLWVVFVVMPLFALANAGVTLRASAGQFAGSSVVWGIVLGLALGKPLGITLFSWLAVRLNMAQLPTSLSWGQLHGIAWLGGIGFTMSLFVASLAFRDTQLLMLAKAGILAGSVLCACVGGFLLWKVPARKSQKDGTTEVAME